MNITAMKAQGLKKHEGITTTFMSGFINIRILRRVNSSETKLKEDGEYFSSCEWYTLIRTHPDFFVKSIKNAINSNSKKSV